MKLSKLLDNKSLLASIKIYNKKGYLLASPKVKELKDLREICSFRDIKKTVGCVLLKKRVLKYDIDDKFNLKVAINYKRKSIPLLERDPETNKYVEVYDTYNGVIKINKGEI